jgi:hypothetical protein
VSVGGKKNAFKSKVAGRRCKLQDSPCLVNEKLALLIILVIGFLIGATFSIMRGSSHPKRAKTTSDNRKTTHPPVTADELGRVTTGYQHWLTRQPLSANTRRAYLGRVRQYCLFGNMRERLR